MKTLQEVLELVDGKADRRDVETYIVREWIRPHAVAGETGGWYFEEIDIARLRLVCHLTRDINVNDEGVDVALSLLDQLYGLRAHMKHLAHAITRQPPDIREGIMELVMELEKMERSEHE